MQLARHAEPCHQLRTSLRMRSHAECRVISLKVPDASVRQRRQTLLQWLKAPGMPRKLGYHTGNN